MFIEGEHHAVYVPPSGAPWRDITPAQSPDIKRRLFLPDDTATYDFANEGIRRDNVRLALSDDPLVGEFFARAEERTRIWNAIPGIGEVKVDPVTYAKLQAAELAQAQVQFQLAIKYTPPNDRCFCASGRKFNRCHGRT